MKANIIKSGTYKGMKFNEGYTYMVSEPTYNQLIELGIALDDRPPKEVKAEEVKAPKKPAKKKAVKVTKEQKFEAPKDGMMIKMPAAKITKPSLIVEQPETTEENEG